MGGCQKTAGVYRLFVTKPLPLCKVAPLCPGCRPVTHTRVWRSPHVITGDGETLFQAGHLCAVEQTRSSCGVLEVDVIGLFCRRGIA